MLVGAAHENDVWQVFLACSLLIFLWRVGQGLKHKVGFEVVQDLVVSEVGVLWQVEDWLVLDDLIVFIVEHLDEPLSDEPHFLHVGSVWNDDSTGVLDSTEHVDDHLIGKAALALLEEMLEGSLELLEDSGVLDKVSLHLWSDLLEEGELFNNKVEIV